MICVEVNGITRQCAPQSGGVSRLLVYDSDDFDWTQDPTTKAYSAVQRNPEADDYEGSGEYGLFFDISFKRKEAEFKITHSIGASGAAMYAAEMEALYPALGQDLTNWLSNMDAASFCCGLGLVIVLNSGVIYVMGERWVGSELLDPYYEVVHNGTEITSGKSYDDLMGATVKFTSDYVRAPNTFSGGLASILALMSPPPPNQGG